MVMLLERTEEGMSAEIADEDGCPPPSLELPSPDELDVDVTSGSTSIVENNIYELSFLVVVSKIFRCMDIGYSI